jgi:peptidyl-dipeptidase Dcp
MLRNGILLLAIGVAMTACSEPPVPAADTAETTPASEPAPAPQAERENPLFVASDLPLQAPPFDRIRDADFKPAFEEGMKRQLAEVEAIANSSEAPTFDNTFVALEKSGRLLDRTTLVFDALTAANTNPELQALQEEMAPLQAAHEDAIYLNPKLFERIRSVYDQRETLDLDPESRRLVEWYYADFVHHGAKLSDADKAKLKELNKEVSTLNAQFIAKLLAATKAGTLVIDDKAKLAGLNDGEIAAAAQDAKSRGLDGKWVIPLQNTTQQPLLVSLADREVRKQLFDNSWTRTEKGDDNDTRATITRMAELRAEQAKLLGFDS